MLHGVLSTVARVSSVLVCSRMGESAFEQLSEFPTPSLSATLLTVSLRVSKVEWRRRGMYNRIARLPAVSIPVFVEFVRKLKKRSEVERNEKVVVLVLVLGFN